MNAESDKPSGPLSGVRVIEFAGLGPGPFAAMLLSDLGAEVLRIDRPGTKPPGATDVIARGRRSLVMNLKSPTAVQACLSLMEQAHVVIEGFRPGVMERLGLGPDAAHARNEKLIYARMTGWGQEGPLAHAAGHDINYIAITGALAAMGEQGRAPRPPLNLVGDFGGGSLYLVVGILAALLEAQRSGKGQVVDAAIVDGTVSLMAMAYGLRAAANGPREERLLDGSAHYYRCYECADGRYVAVGPLEPHFYRLLLQKIGAAEDLQSQEPEDWSNNAETMAALLKTKTRDEWCAQLEGTDACFAPVLEMSEAHRHPHMAARQALIKRSGVLQPAPAPRFSRTPGAIQGPPPDPDQGGMDLALHWGTPPHILQAARQSGGQ